jgi:ribonuclease HII
MTWQVVIACCVGLISILGSVVTVTAVIIQMKANITRLEGSDSKRLAKEEAIDKQVMDLIVMLKEFMGVQSQVNVNVANQLENQSNTNERVAQVLTDVVSRLASMEHSTVEAGQIVSLLTEVLKQQRVITQS